MDIFDLFPELSEEEKGEIQNVLSGWHRQFLEMRNLTEESYSALCKPYQEECGEFTEIYDAHIGRRAELQAELEGKIAREEKSIGGESIYRGLYCPSPVRDIVVGNCKRGKHCRPGNPKASYTYYFDREDRLIAVRKDCSFDTMEYISYHGDRSVGIQFNGDHLEMVCVSEYDAQGRIVSNKEVLFYPCSREVYQCEKELYTYADDTLIVEHSYLTQGNPPNLSLNRYVFAVEDGYLKSYVVEVFDTKDVRDEPLKGRAFSVKLKRKI